MSVASQLKERVRIEQLSVADDGYGGQTRSWVTLATVFAQVEPVFSMQGERAIAEQPTARAGYRVVMRVRTDMAASMRLIWKTHTLLIHSIHESDAMLVLLTYEEIL